ncbi:MAG: UDP-N-acetyl-D-glucosamine 2-epimerase, UDP-hydrolysing [Elusimicrobia bacterium RIFOXYD2_FULL_34_15]|nr:MAG: UDP-N-acetyl-D-glucosamine 2-epimerase, UDP-hydrolysing [Elusimicrobia bacterium RIFOXYD2_FULL_34_15]HAM37850.1 UDP-N-acetylglucosamine 2-epimerase (hydrolyzing) [Elusimicrobiota bacterium]
MKRKRKRKIGIVIGSRANYASIKSVARELKKNRNIELHIYAGASAILDKYGKVEDIIEKDGFHIDERFYMLVEGETPETMAMSTGLGIIRLVDIFQNQRPDIVITVGDRFETMATAISAAYLNIFLAHTMGGEVSGTVDESIRHAVTKFAHIHFPANKRASDRIIKMGEEPKNVFVTGCPRIDIVKEVIEESRKSNNFNEDNFWKKYKGVGGNFSLKKEKFLLVLQHPVTTEFHKNREHINETLMALNELKIPTIMLWPNADAGSDEISKGIRTFREEYKPDWFHIFKNLPMEVFVQLMDMCKVLIGNTSSAIREGAIVGVPVVNIGTRQQGRCRGKNVFDVNYNKNEIVNAIKKQIEHGKYKPDYIYGDGKAGKKIAKILSEIDLNKVDIQKRILI